MTEQQSKIAAIESLACTQCGKLTAQPRVRLTVHNRKCVDCIVRDRERMLAACRLCDRAITEFMEANQPIATDWINLRAARTQAHKVVVDVEGST